MLGGKSRVFSLHEFENLKQVLHGLDDGRSILLVLVARASMFAVGRAPAKEQGAEAGAARCFVVAASGRVASGVAA